MTKHRRDRQSGIRISEDKELQLMTVKGTDPKLLNLAKLYSNFANIHGFESGVGEPVINNEVWSGWGDRPTLHTLIDN